MLITGVRTILSPLSIAIFLISIAILPANAAVLSSRGGTAASKDYIILPKDSATPNDKKAFGDKLLKSVGDKNKIYTSDVDCCGIGFWSVPLTDQQRTDLSTNDVVDAIEEDVEEKWSSVEPPTTQGRSLKYDIRDSLAKRAIVHECFSFHSRNIPTSLIWISTISTIQLAKTFRSTSSILEPIQIIR